MSNKFSTSKYIPNNKSFRACFITLASQCYRDIEMFTLIIGLKTKHERPEEVVVTEVTGVISHLTPSIYLYNLGSLNPLSKLLYLHTSVTSCR